VFSKYFYQHTKEYLSLAMFRYVTPFRIIIIFGVAIVLSFQLQYIFPCPSMLVHI